MTKTGLLVGRSAINERPVWRVLWRGGVCRPVFPDQASAASYLGRVAAGVIKPDVDSLITDRAMVVSGGRVGVA